MWSIEIINLITYCFFLLNEVIRDSEQESLNYWVIEKEVPFHLWCSPRFVPLPEVSHLLWIWIRIGSDMRIVLHPLIWTDSSPSVIPLSESNLSAIAKLSGQLQCLTLFLRNLLRCSNFPFKPYCCFKKAIIISSSWSLRLGLDMSSIILMTSWNSFLFSWSLNIFELKDGLCKDILLRLFRVAGEAEAADEGSLAELPLS